MKRPFLLLAAVAVLIGLAGLAGSGDPGLLLLQWAHKAPATAAPVAVLIEMGLKDKRPTDWSGRAAVTGARVVQREGYRFRAEDRLIGNDGWQAASHRPMRVPPGSPQLTKMLGHATVGVVLHLAEVKDNARLALTIGDKAEPDAIVPLADVLAGRGARIFQGQAVVRLVSTAMPVTQGPAEHDFPAACYGPDGTLWLAYVRYTLRAEGRRIEQGKYREPPASFQGLYKPALADQLIVQSYRGGKWSEPIAVTGPKESIARCAIAAEGSGDVWVVYSALREGSHDLYARPIRKNGELGTEQRLNTAPGPDITPVLCTGPDGSLYGTCQAWRKDGHATTRYWLRCRGGKWDTRERDYAGQANEWHPAVTAGLATCAVAHDVYEQGDYDVVADEWDRSDKAVQSHKVATSSRFEARPSVAYDPKGRLWIAHEEGPEKWGKDSGALVRSGNPLYSERSVRVVCLQDGKLLRPVAELPASRVKNPGAQFEEEMIYQHEKATRYAYPQIGIDGKGRVWLTYRQNFGSRYSTHAGSYWLTFARRLDGDHWTEPIELHHSDGLLDSRPIVLPHSDGGLLVVHNTDSRHTTPETVHNQIYLSRIDLPGEPVEPKLVPHEPGQKNPQTVAAAAAESRAVQRIRTYRIPVEGKECRLLRGDFHRHTEISWDGGADGSLEDMFRYAIDAASLDWIGNGDHDNGGGREYSWWLTQKLNDAYHVPGAFTPMFSYERSVRYPDGHRNVLFAKRGVLTLPRLQTPKKDKTAEDIHPGDTKMLYRYLKELGGICASHTSATSMGTDWRDNDPVVEPVVEIYQGDRMSYEMEGAPRAGHDPKSGEKPANIAGWYPKGFINHALEKGYRLGFQSSSDHWSTHISFFIILAEKNDRESIIKAIKKRHCYGATDNIIVDVRSGNHVMGDELKTAEAPALEIHVIGTGKLAKIDVLRDSDVVATLRPNGEEHKGAWTDPAPRAGTHYYYVRVLQENGEIAWASPLWITRE
jgi:hypothetical protein